MLPIPAHLRDIFHPIGENNSEYEVSGIIRCRCNSESFHLLTFSEYEDGTIGLAGYGDKFGLVVKATCAACHARYTLFDDSCHGYNGVIVRDDHTLTVPDHMLKPWDCAVCEESAYTINMTLQSMGREEFITELQIAEGNTGFAPEDWLNAFDWIFITLNCHKCGHRHENWLDHECA